MSRRPWICWGLLLAGAWAVPERAAAQPSRAPELLRWSSLVPRPTPRDGACVGSSGGALLSAGGAVVSVDPSFEPPGSGRTTILDTILVLEAPDGEWRQADQRLPSRLAYAATVPHRDSILCVGGTDGSSRRIEVLRLRWNGRSVDTAALPPLPIPLTRAAAAVSGDVLYVAGGLQAPNLASRRAWALDLEGPSTGWTPLPPWPGSARYSAVAAAQDGHLYVLGGARGESGAQLNARPLSDSYRYAPGPAGGTWTRIADAPRPLGAAGPAIPLGQSHLVVLVAPETSGAGEAPVPLVYHTVTDSWLEHPTMAMAEGAIDSARQSWTVPLPAAVGAGSDTLIRLLPVPARQPFGAINWVVVALYLLGLLLMGLYFAKREHSTADFFLAGHRIPGWAAGVSIFGTQLSAISFMAVPAVAYATDWVRLAGNWTLVAVAVPVVMFFLPFFRRLGVTTAYEYLERRFNLAVRLFGSSLFILFQLGRIGVVLYLPAIALSAVTGIDVAACIIVMGIFCTVYTVLGGIEAVIWTDVLQVLVLGLSAIWCLGIIVLDAGGPGALLQAAASDDKLRMWNAGWSPNEMVVWVMLVGSFFTSLVSYTTDQTVIQRYLTTPDEAEAAKGIWTNALLSVPAGLLFFGLGTALYVYYSSHPSLLVPGRHDEILPWFMVRQLPAGIAGLGIAGIFAASMSSLDSSMNSVATSVVNDFYRRLRPAVSDRACMTLARQVTLVMGGLGVTMALVLASRDDIRSIFDYFNGLLGLLGGGLMGVFFLAVFSRRATATGALAGAVVGAIVPLVVQQTTSVQFYLYAVIGMVACLLSGYLVSLAAPGPQRDLTGLTVRTLGTRPPPTRPEPPRA